MFRELEKESVYDVKVQAVNRFLIIIFPFFFVFLWLIKKWKWLKSESCSFSYFLFFPSFFSFLHGWLKESYNFSLFTLVFPFLHFYTLFFRPKSESKSKYDAFSLFDQFRFGMSNFSRVFNFYVKTAGWSISLLLWLILYKHVTNF